MMRSYGRDARDARDEQVDLFPKAALVTPILTLLCLFHLVVDSACSSVLYSADLK